MNVALGVHLGDGPVDVVLDARASGPGPFSIDTHSPSIRSSDAGRLKGLHFLAGGSLLVAHQRNEEPHRGGVAERLPDRLRDRLRDCASTGTLQSGQYCVPSFA